MIEQIDEKDIYRRAHSRAEARVGFFWHLMIYIVINCMLVVVWFFASAQNSYFWPIWPILGWGVGLIFNFLSVFLGEGLFRNYRERKTAEFMEQERKWATHKRDFDE